MGKPYSLTGTELTQKMVDKFNTVVSLQSFILAYSLQVAHKDYHQAAAIFILTASGRQLFRYWLLFSPWSMRARRSLFL